MSIDFKTWIEKITDLLLTLQYWFTMQVLQHGLQAERGRWELHVCGSWSNEATQYCRGNDSVGSILYHRHLDMNIFPTPLLNLPLQAKIWSKILRLAAMVLSRPLASQGIVTAEKIRDFLIHVAGETFNVYLDWIHLYSRGFNVCLLSPSNRKNYLKIRINCKSHP